MMRWLLRFAWVCVCVQMGVSSAAAAEPMTLKPPTGTGVMVPAYFGIHVHNNGSARNWPDIPVGSLRLWDTRVAWFNIEPRPNQWDFARLDEFVDWAQSRHVEVVMPLGLTPRWASARPNERAAYGMGMAAEPSDIKFWRNYVSTLAKRYRGRIAAYEIWNEANIKSFYSGTQQTIVDLTVAASEELRREDPAAKLIAPSGVGLDGRLQWPSQILALGAGAVVDAASFHLYHGNGEPEQIIVATNRLRAYNKAAGFESMPLWNTEFGYWMPNEWSTWQESERRNEISEQTAADYLPRDLILAAALGYQRFFWYSWDHDKMGMLEPSDMKTLRRIGKTYGQTIQVFSGAAIEQCVRDATGLWTCRMRAPDGSRMQALWVDPHATERLQTVVPPFAGRSVRVDGVSAWAPTPGALKIGPVVTVISDKK